MKSKYDKDSFDLLYKEEDRVIYFWRISTGFNVLTFGWLLLILSRSNGFLYKEDLGSTFLVGQFLILFFYGFGYLFSCYSLWDSYKNLSSAYETVSNEIDEEYKLLFKNRFKFCLFKRRILVFGSHLIYFIIIALVIFCPKILLMLKRVSELIWKDQNNTNLGK